MELWRGTRSDLKGVRRAEVSLHVDDDGELPAFDLADAGAAAADVSYFYKVTAVNVVGESPL